MGSVLAKLLDATPQLLAVVTGGLLSGLGTYFVTKWNFNRQSKQQEAKDRTDFLRKAVETRLELQTKTLDEYLAFGASTHVRDGKILKDNSLSHQRKMELVMAEAMAKAGGLQSRLVLAFGSVDFAQQAYSVLLMFVSSDQDPTLELVSTHGVNKCINEMIKAIEATRDELGLPKPAYVPTPLLDPKVFNPKAKREIFKHMAAKAGYDPKKVDEIFDKVENDADQKED